MPAGQRSRVIHRGKLRLERAHSAYSAYREDGQHDDHSHLHDELEQVGDEDAPQTGERGDERREHDDSDYQHQRPWLADPQHQHQYFHHGEIHPAEDNAVNGNAEVQRPKPAQERRRFAAVADLGEFDIGHNAGAPPQARIEEHCHHAGGHHVPPQPVARDAA